MSSGGASEPATRSRGQYIRQEVWGGLEKGQKVFVRNPKMPRIWRVRFEFLCHVRNLISGDEWLEVYGGLPGHIGILAVKAEHVVPVARRRA